jgi:hypothetical protein
VPTGNGTTNDWNTAFGAATKWDCVNDPVGSPDDATTYAASEEQPNPEQTFTFAAFSITSSAITKVTVTVRWACLAGEVRHSAVIVVGGTNYPSANSDAKSDSTYETDVWDWLTNPATGLAWTEAAVEGLLEFGVGAEAMNPGDTVAVTQVYATVDYTAAAGGGGIVRQMLMHHEG